MPDRGTHLPIGRRSVHWDRIYRTRGEVELSWHQDEPALSLRLIRTYGTRGARVIDVGGGSSLLAGRLVARGYPVTVLDISRASAARARARLGAEAAGVRWRSGDIARVRDLGSCGVWHDRAVFHFLTRPREKERYRALARRTVVPGGVLILATFAPDGPRECSGLPVARYDAAGMARELGAAFQPVAARREVHTTPWGTAQPFVYSVFRRGPARS